MRKKRVFLLLGATLLTFILFLCASNSADECRITYLGNCGFMYENAESKVLIDPFGTEYGNYFHLPSDKLINNIIEGRQPFNRIDVLLITHIHGDHFNAKLAEACLLKQPDLKMICPGQVYRQMVDSCTSLESIRSQIISPKLEMGETIDITPNDIQVKAIRLQHGTMRSLEGIDSQDYSEYEKTENFGYVINLHGYHIFHQGDAALEINSNALHGIETNIHLAHLSFFDWDSSSYILLKDEMQADQVIFMHGTIPAEELKKDALKEILPELIMFVDEMESKQLNTPLK